MYCEPMVERQTPEKQRLYRSDGNTEVIKRHTCSLKPRCVYRRTSEKYAQNILHDHSKFNTDVLLRHTYYR